MLDTLTEYVAGLDPFWFYIALFASSYVENVFPPVPGDTVTVFAAYVAGRSDRSLTAVFLATTLGGVAGFMTYYVIGRLIHPDYLAEKNYSFLPASSLEAAGNWFHHYGYWIVLFNRFFSGVRSMISIVCGMYELPWPRILVLAGISSAFWNVLLIGAGYILGSNWKMIEQILRSYTGLIMVVALTAALVWLVRRRLSKAP
jgi:membrane protein DedA with SNARE-associated domain